MANPKTLTTEETEKLLTELLWIKKGLKPTPKGERNFTIALLMLDAGLRVGEVVQLRGHNLYFNCVPVTSIIVSPEIAKNNTERIIPVSQRLSNALKKHFEYQTTLDRKCSHYFVFHGPAGFKPLTTRQVERIIRAAGMKSLGRPVHPHVLRHTFASRLMRTTNARVVQELLGHKQLSSTQIYTHPNSEDLKKAIDGIEAAAIHSAADTIRTFLSPDTPNRPDTPGTDRDMG